MITAYYNEIDPFAAQWLRNLIEAGLIAPGDVDERSIEDVRPDELGGYTQCHFFAGIGVWSYALRRAGWADDEPVWTGSCPCQPFSAAGKRGGTADERHLWPAFHHLIRTICPPVVLGEQVASKDGLAWLDTVQADLEAASYAFGAVDLCAAGVGAPHIRQRSWFVGLADDDDEGLEGRRQPERERTAERIAGPGGVAERLADDDDDERESRGRIQRFGESNSSGAGSIFERSAGFRANGRLADSDGGKPGDGELQRSGQHGQQQENGCTTIGVAKSDVERRPLERLSIRSGQQEQTALVEQRGDEGNQRPGPTNGYWQDADWLCCRDAKWRPVEPGTFPLVNGAPARVGRLRAYGNAIVAEVAKEFVEAVMFARQMHEIMS